MNVLESGVPCCTNISHIYKKRKKILKHIHWTMRFIPHISTPKKDRYGITYIAHIKDNVRMFLQCVLLIANRFFVGNLLLFTWRNSKNLSTFLKSSHKKIKNITFGTTQIPLITL